MNAPALPTLMLAELRKSLLLVLRYPLQPALAMLVLLALFGALWFAGTSDPARRVLDVGSAGVEPRVLVACFVCWMVATGAVGHLANAVEEDIKAGLLEPVFLSRHAPWQVLLARSLAGSCTGLLFTVALLALLTWRMDVRLHLGPATWLALLLLELSLCGLGLGLAGMVVLFKRAGALAPLLQLAVGIMAARQMPPQADGGSVFLPVASAIELFSRALFGTALDLATVGAVLAWTALSLALGVGVLRLCVHRARRAGSLAHA